MIRFFRRLWDRMNEPETERKLIVLLPCLSIAIAFLILAPRLLSMAKQALSLPDFGHSGVMSTPQPLYTDLPPTDPSASPVPVSSEPSSLPAPEPTGAPVSEPVFTDGRGWREEDGKLYYYNSRGEKLTGLKQVDGKLYYFAQDGAKARALGIDVSFYNKGINWPAVKAQGIDFAILRAGGRGWETGLIYSDACFAQNLRNAKKAGIKLGVYFYSTAATPAEAIAEAVYVTGCLNGCELDFPIFFDTEQSGDYPKGRADRLSKARRAEIIEAFCHTVMDSGYRAGIYSGQFFFRDHVAFTPLKQYTIWLASYTKYNRLPGFDDRYDIWQFTDSGTVNGIRGMVDMNVIF